MSIHSGYVDVFLDRIKRIAATGLDGIWLDVPLFSELGAAWPDAGPAAAAKFLADTGMQVPRTRRLGRSGVAPMDRVALSGDGRVSCCACATPRARSPSGISIMVETVTLDYGLATLVGLDGSLLKDAPASSRRGRWTRSAMRPRCARRCPTIGSA